MADGLSQNIVGTATTGAGVAGNAIWARNLSTFAFFRFKSVEGAGTRMFIGMTDQALTTMAVGDAALGNYTGIRIGGGFTNWTLVSRNTSQGQTNITINGVIDTNMHELKIWLPNNGQCYVQFDSQATYTFSASQCPDNNAIMRYAITQQNTTASYKNTRVGRIYLEAER